MYKLPICNRLSPPISTSCKLQLNGCNPNQLLLRLNRFVHHPPVSLAQRKQSSYSLSNLSKKQTTGFCIASRYRRSFHTRTRAVCNLSPFTSKVISRYGKDRDTQIIWRNSTTQTQQVANSFSPYSTASAKPLLKSTSVSMAPSGESADSASSKKAFQRLPTNAVPTNYAVSIKPDLVKFTFEGEEAISLEIKEVSKRLLMNASELEVSKIVWESSDCSVQVPTKWACQESEETLEVLFDPPLNQGSGTLKLTYTGSLNDKMKGFYRSKCKSPDGVEYYNGVTQFEATDARKALACWDEPAVKATFDVTLIVPKDKVALSNMPEKEVSVYEADPSLKVVKYERTPIMSTYLLAWIVGEFDYTETKSSDGVLCRVYTPPGKKEQGLFALDVTAKVLPYYKNYFGIAYPLPKLDLIAIADFSSGAMENWGLITYRETCLLVDDKNTSAASRQWIALVVGHEIAHQWFGNLVTMDWWTHLWLNEGYASFVEFLCVEHLFPEYDIWTQFVTVSHIRAMELDCLKNSHPIEVEVGHPSEIDEIFDDISYSKGSAVIRMLHNYIGDPDFRKGMNIYLTRHQFKNTFTEDLWKALEEASSKPIGAVMSTWTKQMGFPIIRLSNVKQQGTKRTFTVSQEKFWADPQLMQDKEASKEYRWMVPLTFSTGAKPGASIHEILLDKGKADVVIEGVDPAQWVKLNPGTIGFYRVQYPTEMLEDFLPGIRSKSMPPLDRLGLLDDLFALVQAGQSPSTDVLKLLTSFVDEDNYTVWASITNVVSKLGFLLAHTNCHDSFKSFGRNLFSTILGKVGWEPRPGEDHLQAMLRSLVLNCMTKFEHEDTIKEALKKFDQHITGEKHVVADLRAAVYKAVFSTCNQDTFNTMVQLYRDSDTMEEQDRIGRCMGALKDQKLLQQALEFAISSDVRNQDTIFIIVSIGFGKFGRELAWEFFKNNWELFHKRYTGTHLSPSLVKRITENFTTKEHAQDVENFFKEHPFPGTERAVQQALETIYLNEAWLKRDLPHIQQYLKALTV